jgi:hypothetical protein
MAKKQNLRLVDEGGNRITLFRPSKNSSDELLHLEIENDGWNNAIITCMNLDFVQASELADALIRFSRKLKFEVPLPIEDEGAQVSVSCTVAGCLCKEEWKTTPDPVFWGWGWDDEPVTVNTSPTNFHYEVHSTVSDGS